MKEIREVYNEIEDTIKKLKEVKSKIETHIYLNDKNPIILWKGKLVEHEKEQD